MEILRSLAPLVIIGIIFGISLAVNCVKAPPDTAVIITGFWKKPRVLIERAGIKIPFLERTDELCLRHIPITIYTKCLSADFIKVKSKVVINVQISDEEDMLRLAAKNFLNYYSSDIVANLYDTLSGVINETLRSQTVSGICKGWGFIERCLYNNIASVTGNLGIKVLSCHILKISTPDGIIKNMAEISSNIIKKEVITAERDLQLAKAEAQLEKIITQSNVLLNTNDFVKFAKQMLEDIEKISSHINNSLDETADESSSECKELEMPDIEKGYATTETIKATAERTNSHKKYEATINHIGEMIRKDFEED